MPEGVRTLELAENIGITAGRNVGAAEVSGDVLLFLDDDAVLLGTGVLASAIASFDADPTLAVVQPRVVHPDDHAAYYFSFFDLRIRGSFLDAGSDHIAQPRAQAEIAAAR